MRKFYLTYTAGSGLQLVNALHNGVSEFINGIEYEVVEQDYHKLMATGDFAGRIEQEKAPLEENKVIAQEKPAIEELVKTKDQNNTK